MKKPSFSLDLRRWQTAILSGVALLAMAGLYIVRLGWPGKLSSSEQAIASGNASLSNIVHNPLNGLYKLVDYVWLRLPGHHIVFARMASVCFTLGTATLFYLIAKRWHGRLSAAYGVLIFAVSTWLLHAGRLGDGQIMFVLTPLALLFLASWLNTTACHDRAIWLYGVVTALALFTPGAVWFALALPALLGKVLVGHLKQARTLSVIIGSLFLGLSLAILVFTFWRNASLIMPWLGVPHNLAAPLTLLAQWAGSLGYLFVRGPSLHGQWLAHTPVLDIATTALILLGAFLYVRHFNNLRTRLLLVFFLLGSLLVALNGAIALGFILGTMYLVAATGLAYFQHLWFQKFPKNPIARNLAASLMVVLALAIGFYHTQRYFIAWRHSPVTQATFTDSTPRSDLIQ